jgi:superfamily II DNA/RNA helicase
LDIQGLEFVLNFNLPYLAEDYVHRIGRAGRAGQKGTAISFVSREEERTLDNIERLIGNRIRRIQQPGFEVSNRDSLIKTVSRKARPARSNKSSQARSSNSKVNKLAGSKPKKAAAPKKPKNKAKKKK